MISKALQLLFFWRRNHLPSIAFKCTVWGFIAWLAVGMFTNVKLALIAAAVIACMSALKYGLKSRKQTKKLMEMCGGDPLKFAALQARLNTPGMAGTLMREMLNAEIDDDDDDEYDEPITEEQRQANISGNVQLINKMASLTRQFNLATDAHCEETEQDLLNEYSSGDNRLELTDVVSEFLPDNAISICTEDFINEDDHASLVEEFSAATNDGWVIEDCTSAYDEDAKRWVVMFKENDKEKIWRFAQDSDLLSEKFLQQLINYTESASGYTVTVLDTEDYVSLICLPNGMYDSLSNNSAVNLAA